MNHKSAVIIIIIIISAILSLGVILSYQSTLKRSATIILPGGITYLGPSPAPAPTITVQTETKDGKFTAPVVVDQWLIWKGNKYPFTFRYPPTLPIAGIVKDAGDAVGVGWKNSQPEESILFRIVKTSTPKPTSGVRKSIPGRTDLVAQFTNPILDPPVFNAIVESFEWNSNPTNATNPTNPTNK